jgi:hypothetical protein
MIVAFDATQRLPEALAVRNANRYFSKVVATADRVYLFGSHGVDVLDSSIGERPRFLHGIAGAGLIDVAASPDHLFTLASNGTVATYSDMGALVAQTTLDEGADARPLAIATAGGAVWVAYEKGCLSGGCERKTLVLDPRTLAVTATLPGAVVEAVTEGRAYALFSLPNEIRIFDIADPLHPAQILATEADPSINSLAYANGTLYALGDRLYTFAEATLAAGTTHLAAMNPDASQRIRFDAGCLSIIGRAANPELYGLPQFRNSTSFELPSTARSIAAQNGRLYVLTDHSLETWSVAPAGPAPRRRATR